MKEKLFSFVFLCLFSFGLLFVGDRVLGLVGFPSEPPLPIAHAPNFTEKKKNIDFEHSIVTNSKGIRYTEIPLKKDASKEFRVAVIGDSFTEGLGVEAEDTFSARLEKKFSGSSKQVRFINFGLIGAGPAEEARLLQFRALQYEPDLVLLVLYANDVTDAEPMSQADLESGEGWLVPRKTMKRPEHRRSEILLHKLFPRIHTMVAGIKKKQEAKKAKDFLGGTVRQARRQGISEEKIEAWKKIVPDEIVEQANHLQFDGYLYSDGLLRPSYLVESLDIEGEKTEERWRTTSFILSKMASICKERNIPVTVVYAPSPVQSDPSYISPSKDAGMTFREEWLTGECELQKRFSSWAQENGLPYFDLTGPIREAARSEPAGALHFKHDPHWTPKGHEYVASAIAGWLRELKVLPE